MANKTVKPHGNTFSGSIAAGMGSVFNPGGRRYYILEHKVSSKYHKQGESQEIIVDTIELGRDSKCQVRYDESFPTVSRRHAAIVKDGENWKLVQLSTTNTTFLNGRPIKDEWYLQNGDEIQLSVNGPKLGFIIPTGNKATVGSIGLTRRLSLFRQQAMRPYKTTIGALAVLLLISIIGFGSWGYFEHDARIQDKLLAEARADSLSECLLKADSALIQNREYTDSVRKASEISNKQLSGRQFHLQSALSQMKAISGIADDAKLKAALNSVYYVRVEKVVISFPGGNSKTITRDSKEYQELFWSGTGFLLNDGRFITARHVIDGLKFISSLADVGYIMLNDLENKGADVTFTFGAYSPNHSFSFTNKNFIMNRSSDEVKSFEMDFNDDGVAETYHITLASAGGGDWACMHTSYKGSLKANSPASTSLKQQTNLVVLGYPKGYYAENVKAIQGSCMVAADGLHRGVIVITGRNFEHGNSGGPVLQVLPDGSMEVIGIISAGYGDTVGFIVPISNIR